MLEREIDGKLQVIAAMRLLRFSRLIQLNAGSSQFTAVSNDSSEFECKDIDPVCGRLICWTGFSAGAECFAKGVCLLRDVEVRTSKQGATNFGTLGDLIGRNKQKGKLGHLLDAIKAKKRGAAAYFECLHGVGDDPKPRCTCLHTKRTNQSF